MSQNRKQHVLILPSWYAAGGLEGVFIHEHARMTASRGHKTGLLFVEKRAFSERNASLNFEKDGIHTFIRKAWFPPKTGLLMAFWLHQYTKEFSTYVRQQGKPDVLHAHGFLAGIAARCISRRQNIPYVITEHNTSVASKQVGRHHLVRIRKAYGDAGALIAVSAMLAEGMRAYTTKGIEVIPNPVDGKLFSPASQELEGRHIVWVGSLEERKNPALLISMLSHVALEDDWHLHIIGEGPLMAQIRGMVESAHLLERITWHGNLTLKEVAVCLSQADIVLSTSRLETFGMTLAEALMCGVPVLATPSGGPQEYIESGDGRVTASDDPQIYGAALEDMILHLAEYNKTEIRKRALQRHDFPSIGARIDAVYDLLINGK